MYQICNTVVQKASGKSKTWPYPAQNVISSESVFNKFALVLKIPYHLWFYLAKTYNGKYIIELIFMVGVILEYLRWKMSHIMAFNQQTQWQHKITQSSNIKCLASAMFGFSHLSEYQNWPFSPCATTIITKYQE